MIKVIKHYFLIIFILLNLWLAFLLIGVNHQLIGLYVIGLIVAKGVAVVRKCGKCKAITLSLLNTMWAFNTLYFLLGQHPIDLPFMFPLFVFLVGVGIALRGRFDE